MPERFVSRSVFAADKRVKIGIDVSLTGAGAEDAILVKNGALMAIDDANANGGPGGYTIEPMVLDDGTATAGQYDPAQAANNARKMVSDPDVVAAVGPQNSGCGKAMAPIFSQGDLATITPSSTNPDITDPKFAAQFDPSGRAIYFRVVTTDAYQGPAMANYMAQVLNVKKVYVLDDSGAYGVGIANTFEGQAKKIGIEVLGHDQLNPLEADYTTLLTKIKPLNLDAIYFGGNALTAGQAGEAGPRHRARHHQTRRRRGLQFRPPERRRVPGDARLVRLHRRALPRREPIGAAVDKALYREIRVGPVILRDHRL